MSALDEGASPPDQEEAEAGAENKAPVVEGQAGEEAATIEEVAATDDEKAAAEEDDAVEAAEAPAEDDLEPEPDERDEEIAAQQEEILTQQAAISALESRFRTSAASMVVAALDRRRQGEELGLERASFSTMKEGWDQAKAAQLRSEHEAEVHELNERQEQLENKTDHLKALVGWEARMETAGGAEARVMDLEQELIEKNQELHKLTEQVRELCTDDAVHRTVLQAKARIEEQMLELKCAQAEAHTARQEAERELRFEQEVRRQAAATRDEVHAKWQEARQRIAELEESLEEESKRATQAESAFHKAERRALEQEAKRDEHEGEVLQWRMKVGEMEAEVRHASKMEAMRCHVEVERLKSELMWKARMHEKETEDLKTIMTLQLRSPDKVSSTPRQRRWRAYADDEYEQRSPEPPTEAPTTVPALPPLVSHQERTSPKAPRRAPGESIPVPEQVQVKSPKEQPHAPKEGSKQRQQQRRERGNRTHR